MSGRFLYWFLYFGWRVKSQFRLFDDAQEQHFEKVTRE